MFVATANSLSIPPALLDRLEVIRLSGYTEDEKISIAKKYLLPKQIKFAGLRKAEMNTPGDGVITDIIRYYTKEAGVRGLEREISKLCRKATKAILTDPKVTKVSVTSGILSDFLGVRKYTYGVAEDEDKVGQVMGLAWTEVGGELLTIEASAMPGQGKIIRTGSLGDVMKESVEAARSVVRSRATSLGIRDDFFEKLDLHVHAPEGATPKDGPSAGIAMTTAIVSALTGIPVKHSVAMTGEITLRGEVLQIGGLKEKLLAAHRGGLKDVLIPEENKKDLTEIPEKITKELNIIPVRWIDQVFELALFRMPTALPEDESKLTSSVRGSKKSSTSSESLAH
jgi:ATP-dependent Lon protease